MGKLADYLRSLFQRNQDFNPEDFRDLLLSHDVDVKVADRLVAALANVPAEERLSVLEREIATMIKPCEQEFKPSAPMNIVLFCGINGSGKTTVIGKMAHRMKHAGVVAGDTFRTAAVEQLQIWSQRAGAAFYAGKEKADPASVIYNAILQAQQDGIQNLLIDTAGRIYNQVDLMEELKKMVRVIKKIVPEAPHEVLLVLDATIGKNLVSQVQFFSQAVPLTGLVMTKLDGTAKGGALLYISQHYKLPVYFEGTGEGIDDLSPFSAEIYSRRLVEE